MPSNRPGLLRTTFFLATILALSGCSTHLARLFPQDRPPQGRIVAAPERTDTGAPDALSEPPVAAGSADTAQADKTEVPPADLWERLRRGFRLDTGDHPRIRRELAWLRANPVYLERTAQRAEPYLYHIVSEAERRGLPRELALVPAIESGFQPRARSPYGAAGLWQFIPSTGRAHGLRQNWWYDGRCDVPASTDAALDYLESLAARFDGDWLLALAAYNAGPGTLNRAIRRNRGRGLPGDYWSLDLPDETRQYVPRLLALARIVADPSAYGVRLPPIDNRPHFARVELPGQIELELAARLAGMSEQRLARLNPGFRRWATDPDGPHRLLLPTSRVAPFTARLADLPREQWVTWHRYRIRRGDTLGGIARRYGVNVAFLQQVNRLQGSRIRTGRHLLIPRNGDGAAALAAAGTAAGPAPEYVVQPGDTLWDIARHHHTSHRKLAAWNGLTVNGTLRPGQTLRLGPGGSQSGDRTISYRVRKGDSLYLIARRFQVTVKDLRRWNTLNGRYLQPGQRLTLQVDEGLPTL